MSDDTNPKDAIASAKPDLALVPPVALVLTAKVMELGAKKYGSYNWRSKKVRQMVYLAAALRHLCASLDGEDVDPESNQPHLAHVAACMAILMDASATGNLIDDRPVKGAAGRLIEELTVKPAHKPAHIPSNCLMWTNPQGVEVMIHKNCIGAVFCYICQERWNITSAAYL